MLKLSATGTDHGCVLGDADMKVGKTSTPVPVTPPAGYQGNPKPTLPMRAGSVFLGFVLLAVIAAKVQGAAQLCATLPPGKAEPGDLRALPVVEVRGDVPYVNYGGKVLAADSGSIQLFENEVIHSSTQITPRWAWASKVKMETKAIVFTNTAGRSVNNELLFSVDLESPVALDKVWIVLSLVSESGDGGNLIQEIGQLRPYALTTVKIHRQMAVDLGRCRYTWHVFARDRELLHSVMGSQTVENELRRSATMVRTDVKNAPAEPLLTFPPRTWSDTAGPVSLELKIAEDGSIKQAAVVAGKGMKIEQDLLEAVGHWWFLPKIVEGQKVGDTLTVTVVPSKKGKWSNESVHLSGENPKL